MDQKLKNRALHRGKIIRGQLEGLLKAIDKEVYCTHLLEQSLSIQKSLKSLDSFILENHLKTHVIHQVNNKNEVDKSIKELLDVYKLSMK